MSQLERRSRRPARCARCDGEYVEQNREASATGHSAAETYGDRGTRAWSGEAGVLVGGSPTILKSFGAGPESAQSAGPESAETVAAETLAAETVAGGGVGEGGRRGLRIADTHQPGEYQGRSGRRLTVGRAGAEAGRDYSPRCVSDRHQTVTANHGASQPTYVRLLSDCARCVCLVRGACDRARPRRRRTLTFDYIHAGLLFVWAGPKTTTTCISFVSIGRHSGAQPCASVFYAH